MSMDLEQRIEAARRIIPVNSGLNENAERLLATWMLEAAFPEFFTSPPTHWLAPWEASPAMENAMLREPWPLQEYGAAAGWVGVNAYAVMRDAYLSPVPEGEDGDGSLFDPTELANEDLPHNGKD